MKASLFTFWLPVILATLLAAWTLASLYGTYGLEEPRYTVVEKRDGYEVRKYAPMIVAETTVDGVGSSANGEAFRRIAKFIFGGNVANDSIAMTAPVTIETGKPETSQKIAMTVPVTIETGAAQTKGGTAGKSTDDQRQTTMAFVMPSKFTLETLPRPSEALQDKVRIRQEPGKKVAVLQFSWFASLDRQRAMGEKLLERVRADNLKVSGAPYYAAYNPPMTIPFLNRHEMMVEIE